MLAVNLNGKILSRQLRAKSSIPLPFSTRLVNGSLTGKTLTSYLQMQVRALPIHDYGVGLKERR